MPAAIASLHQSPMAPSPASADQSSSRRHSIHVVIPPTQESVARSALARTTFTAAAASDDEVLHAEWTPTHGHGAFVVPSAHGPRVQRRDSLFFTPSMADGDGVDAELEAADAHVGSREMSPVLGGERGAGS